MKIKTGNYTTDKGTGTSRGTGYYVGTGNLIRLADRVSLKGKFEY